MREGRVLARLGRWSWRLLVVIEGEGIAAGVLESRGVNLFRVREEVVCVLATKGASD